MGRNRNFQFSLRTLFATITVGIVMGSLWLYIGLASIPATLAVICAFLCLWEWLSSCGVTQSRTNLSLATLFVCAALMAHITLLMAFIPMAARIAANNYGERYRDEFDQELPLEWEEWSYSTQLFVVMFGYPGLALVSLGSAYIEGVWDVRGLTPTVIGCYLVLMPLCIGYLQILKY